MKHFVFVIMILLAVLSAVGWGVSTNQYDFLGNVKNIKPWESVSNSMIIGDGDNPETAYESLIARTDMGTLSSTNRRLLILLPGTYTLTGTWELDTDYVDVAGVAIPDDVLITRGTGGATVTQTAADVRISYLTIQNTGSADGDHGFLIAATTNNDASVYGYLKFSQPNTYKYSKYPVFATSDLGGTWRFCESGKYSWRCANGKSLTATMYDCIADDYSFHGDNELTEAGTGVLSGTLYRCVGGNFSFASCTTYGSNITGTLVDCIAGHRSYAIGKTISGVLTRCKGGTSSFAGLAYGATYYGTISGTAILTDCISEGGDSFAMGNASCVQSGTLIRCTNYLQDGQASGRAGGKASTITDASAAATLTTSYTGEHNDLTFTARHVGKEGNYIKVFYDWDALTKLVSTTITDEYRIIKIKYKSTTLVSDLYTDLLANAEIMSWVSVAYAETDGTGTIASTTDTYYTLSGGAGKPAFVGCGPSSPIVCTANTTVYPFDNGSTYNNTGIGAAAITFTLPAATVGYSYTFCDTDNTAGGDLYIDCVGTDNFVKPDGTAMADAEQYQSNNDTFGKVTATCYAAGVWQLENETGTWVEESP